MYLYVLPFYYLSTFAFYFLFIVVAFFSPFTSENPLGKETSNKYSLARQLDGSHLNREIKLIIREQASGVTATQHKALPSIDTFERIGCVGEAT